MFKCYSVRDAKVESFSTPFYKKSEGEALRDIQRLVNDKSTNVGMFPEDFDLYFVGEFDDSDGKFIPAVPVHVKHCLNLVQV